jgi:hypothetical protein
VADLPQWGHFRMRRTNMDARKTGMKKRMIPAMEDPSEVLITKIPIIKPMSMNPP